MLSRQLWHLLFQHCSVRTLLRIRAVSNHFHEVSVQHLKSVSTLNMADFRSHGSEFISFLNDCTRVKHLYAERLAYNLVNDAFTEYLLKSQHIVHLDEPISIIHELHSIVDNLKVDIVFGQPLPDLMPLTNANRSLHMHLSEPFNQSSFAVFSDRILLQIHAISRWIAEQQPFIEEVYLTLLVRSAESSFLKEPLSNLLNVLTHHPIKSLSFSRAFWEYIEKDFPINSEFRLLKNLSIGCLSHTATRDGISLLPQLSSLTLTIREEHCNPVMLDLFAKLTHLVLCLKSSSELDVTCLSSMSDFCNRFASLTKLRTLCIDGHGEVAFLHVPLNLDMLKVSLFGHPFSNVNLLPPNLAVIQLEKVTVNTECLCSLVQRCRLLRRLLVTHSIVFTNAAYNEPCIPSTLSKFSSVQFRHCRCGHTAVTVCTECVDFLKKHCFWRSQIDIFL
ncbi:hypothetical protein P9112_008861 [Eukaryota sp. TZLM1-RC]